MATYDDPYNPIPRRLREPTPGYSQPRSRTYGAVDDLLSPPRTDPPRGGMPAPGSDPLAGVQERDIIPETFADPLSPTRSMRYGPGDERDLGAPVVDPRSPLAPSPATWGRARYISPDSVKVPEITDWDRRLAGANAENIRREYEFGAGPGYYHRTNDGDMLGDAIPEEYIRRDEDGSWVDLDIAKNRVAEYDAAMARRAALGPEGVRIARDSNGGYAYAHGRPVADQTTPRPLFSGVAGEDFEATRRRGEQVARLMRETDGPFANPNDWNYVRSYGPRAAAQAVASGRASISGAPPELVAQERERFLRNRTTDLSISPQLRSAARDELAQIERDAAEERRREMWAAEQAGLTERASIAASVPVVGPGGVAAIPNADGGWDVSRPAPTEAAGGPPIIPGTAAGWLGEGGKFQPNPLYEKPSETQAAIGSWKTDVQTLANEGKISAAQATAAGRVQAAGIRADAQKYASDKGYEAAVNAATARVEAAKAAGLSAQQVAQIRAQSEQAVAKLAADGALARAGIQADAQKYVSDARYAAAADAAAAAIMAAEAGAGAKVEAERIRAEIQRELAAENPWTAVGGGVMGNRRTGETAGRPNAAGGDAKPQVFKMKGADGSEKLVRANADGTGAEVIFEDPDAALAIAEQEVRNLESDRARYALRDEQREDYDRQIEEAKGRVAALKAAMKSAPEYKGPTGAPPTNDAAGGWAAFGGLVE